MAPFPLLPYPWCLQGCPSLFSCHISPPEQRFVLCQGLSEVSAKWLPGAALRSSWGSLPEPAGTSRNWPELAAGSAGRPPASPTVRLQPPWCPWPGKDTLYDQPAIPQGSGHTTFCAGHCGFGRASLASGQDGGEHREHVADMAKPWGARHSRRKTNTAGDQLPARAGNWYSFSHWVPNQELLYELNFQFTKIQSCATAEHTPACSSRTRVIVSLELLNSQFHCAFPSFINVYAGRKCSMCLYRPPLKDTD